MCMPGLLPPEEEDRDGTAMDVEAKPCYEVVRSDNDQSLTTSAMDGGMVMTDGDVDGDGENG